MLLSLVVLFSRTVHSLDRSTSSHSLRSPAFHSRRSQWNFNPAWLPLPHHAGGALFVRVTDSNAERISRRIRSGGRRGRGLGGGCKPTAPGSSQSHSMIAFVKANRPDGLGYEHLNESHLIVPIAPSLDPRATHRPLTGEYFLTYQCNFEAPDGSLHRKTFLASSKTPADPESWTDQPGNQPMFPLDQHTPAGDQSGDEDCGTCVWFKDDPAANDPAAPPASVLGAGGSLTSSLPPAYALATFGGLRGGNITLLRSDDGLASWQLRGDVLKARPGAWDNATLSSGPCPVRLSTGHWLFFYNVDNKWPVVDPQPIPPYGRCALGWAVLDSDGRVLARASEPLLFATLPFEKDGASPNSVYTDGVMPEGDDTFVIFAGGADSVVEAVRVRVNTPRRRSIASHSNSYSYGIVFATRASWHAGLRGRFASRLAPHDLDSVEALLSTLRPDTDDHAITTVSNGTIIVAVGASDRAVLYAAYSLIERITSVRFRLHGDTLPDRQFQQATPGSGSGDDSGGGGGGPRGAGPTRRVETMLEQVLSDAARRLDNASLFTPGNGLMR